MVGQVDTKQIEITIDGIDQARFAGELIAFAFIGGFIFQKIVAQRTLVKEIPRSSRP